MVGLIQAGAGAVARTVESKLRESVSVLDFGADNTGVADSTAAFNLASAASTQSVVIPAGTYLLNTSPNSGYWNIESGVTFTGTGVLSGQIIEKNGLSGTFIQRLISNNQTQAQLIGFNVEQGLYQTGIVSALSFGQTTELWSPTASTAVWTGSLSATYGSFSHFGSGALNAGYGGDFESFNSGSATATLIVGVVGNAWNGGAHAGYPDQTPSNNGNATNLRGVAGDAKNISSGTVTAASALFAGTISNTGGGTITNAYGLFVSAQTAGVTNYGIFADLGIHHLGDAVNITGRSSLPAQTDTTLWIANGPASPSLGRIYVGNGGGWRLEFAKRTASTDTMLGYFNDTGDFLYSGFLRETSKSVIVTNSLTAYNAWTYKNYYFTGTAGASFAISIPGGSASIDGQTVTIMSTANRAATTWISSGATFVGAPSALVANTPVKLQYDHGTTAWYITA